MTTFSTQYSGGQVRQPFQQGSHFSQIAALVLAMGTIIIRDTRLLLRRPSRIVATLLTPALLWAFFASGFANTIAASGDSASAEYSLSLSAGAALLVVTFASIFGSLGLIRDRESGYLQAVLVGPVPRWVVLGARVASGSLFAFVQAVTMLIVSLMLVDGVQMTDLAGSAVMLALTAIGLSGGCIALAWRFRSIEGFHGIMAGVLLPAWLLSGAVFPTGASQGALAVVMMLNPLSYAHGSIAGALGSASLHPAYVLVTIVFALTGFFAAICTTRGDAKR